MKFIMWLKELHFFVRHIRLNAQNRSHKSLKLLGFQAEIWYKKSIFINRNLNSHMQKGLPSSLTEIRKSIIKVLQLFCSSLFSNRMQGREDTKIFFWPSIICWNGKFWFHSMLDPSWKFHLFVELYSVTLKRTQ